jgi:8-oxo-dGTP pyrophosphatase MutT (NUDIX family)/GNAT superfamily N-acetyltransferase
MSSVRVPTLPRPPRLSVTSVRPAAAADLDGLAALETAADERFSTVLDRSAWSAARCGRERAQRGGSLLVVGNPVVGFAHLVELPHGGRLHAHLEQLSVHPDAGGQGLGTMLLRAVLGEALDRGHDRITLVTYADVPWNAPWYARHGFVELTGELPEHLLPVVGAEPDVAHGGRRVAMSRPLADDPVPRSAVSVIPLRQGRAGLEAFVQHRAATMDFVPGAIVFPGGRVDPQDEPAGARLDLPGRLLEEHLARLPHVARVGPGFLRTLLATGIRELAEETGAVVGAERLLPWDNWVTPLESSRRFDVEFFLLPVDRDELRHTTTEASHSEWLRVEDVVARAEVGELVLVPPTRTIVDELQALGSLEAVLALRPTVNPVRHDVTARRPRPPGHWSTAQ